ncbi:MAG: hypothetical protein KC636_35010, partial [Myxococcales bacterium]|nr:hypothetical protein [Myxococcales bacterium]
MQSIREHSALTLPGFLVLLVVFGLIAFDVTLFMDAAARDDGVGPAIGLAVALLFSLGGFFIVQPNEAKALVFFGRYIGSVRKAGFYWANPFAGATAVSMRVRNFNSERIKVNDARGNPIEIQAVVVWKVTDSARALFDVAHYATFVAIQSETAIRAVASHYPYDPHGDELSLRGNPEEVSAALQKEIHARLDVAGVAVIEARISHLAYATEIAQAMLRRQQAQAIVAARREIVEGAVGMVKMGLEQLEEFGIVDLDNERRAAMVNNLLVA